MGYATVDVGFKYLRVHSLDALHQLQVLDVLLDRLLDADEVVLTKVLLQDGLSASFGQNLAQIPAVVFKVSRDLLVGTNLAHDGEDRIPVVWLGESEDTFVLDVGINQGGDMQACGVLDVHKPFCTSQSARRREWKETWLTGWDLLELTCEALGEDVPDPSSSAGVLALVEDGAKVCVGQDGIALKVRVVLFDIFPDSLLSLGLASAIDIPSSVDLGVGWVCPSLVDGYLVP